MQLAQQLAKKQLLSTDDLARVDPAHVGLVDGGPDLEPAQVLGQQEQAGRVEGRLHRLADGDPAVHDDSLDRRLDGAVVEVDLVLRQGGLGDFDVRLGGADGGLGGADGGLGVRALGLDEVAGDFVAPHYVRFTVNDKPGILAAVTTAYARYGINIEGVLQLPKYRKDRLPFVTTLEECSESVLDRALADVAQSDYHVQPPLALPIFS